MDTGFETRIDFSALNEKIGLLREQMARVIIGQRQVVDLLLTALLADGHVLIEGVPGVAKTLMAKVLSHLIEAGFCRIQFTPDLMPSDVLGTSVFLPSTGKFEFRQGPVFTNILLVDEINRSPAKTQAALFEVMEERQITNDGVEYAMEFPFMVVATQNPVEHEGTYRLPEAQLDRFMFKILVDYPRKEEEIEVLELHDKRSSESWKEQTPVVSVGELSYLREKVHDVHVDGKIKAFIVDIVGTTRDNAWLSKGKEVEKLLHITSLDDGIEIFKALGSDVRIQILNILLENSNMSMKDLAARLNITNGALTGHIKKLESCGLITTSAESVVHGNQKICSVHWDRIIIDLEKQVEDENVYNTEVKIGHYSNYDITPTCGLASSKALIGEVDDARYFEHPDRYNAEILWFTNGFVEYVIPNFIPGFQKITQIGRASCRERV